MPRVIKPKSHDVILSEHAWQRYCERANLKPTPARRNKLRAFLHAKLNNAIGVGLHLDRTGAAWIEIEQLMWASARLTDRGWVVTTVVVWGEAREEAAG